MKRKSIRQGGSAAAPRPSTANGNSRVPDAAPAPRFRRKAACRQLSLAGDMMVCYSTAVLHEGPDPILKEGRPMSKFPAARQGFT